MRLTQQQMPVESVVLCASCDRCRARKAKCDGKRPCSSCITHHKKQNEYENAFALCCSLVSFSRIAVSCFFPRMYSGVMTDLQEVSCVYSPAKRRGPPPSRHLRPAPTTPVVVPTIASHRHLLDPTSSHGNTLRSHVYLAVSSLADLMEISPAPTSPALSFAVLAVGAIIAGESSTFAMELCNAAVNSLREAEESSSEHDAVWDRARAYFFLGVFRAMKGDMRRYFQYRRVVFSYAAQVKVRACSTDLAGRNWAYELSVVTGRSGSFSPLGSRLLS